MTKDNRIIVRLKPELLIWLEEYAEAQGKGKSDIVREALKEYRDNRTDAEVIKRKQKYWASDEALLEVPLGDKYPRFDE